MWRYFRLGQRQFLDFPATTMGGPLDLSRPSRGPEVQLDVVEGDGGEVLELFLEDCARPRSALVDVDVVHLPSASLARSLIRLEFHIGATPIIGPGGFSSVPPFVPAGGTFARRTYVAGRSAPPPPTISLAPAFSTSPTPALDALWSMAVPPGSTSNMSIF